MFDDLNDSNSFLVIGKVCQLVPGDIFIPERGRASGRLNPSIQSVQRQMMAGRALSI